MNVRPAAENESIMKLQKIESKRSVTDTKLSECLDSKSHSNLTLGGRGYLKGLAIVTSYLGTIRSKIKQISMRLTEPVKTSLLK